MPLLLVLIATPIVLCESVGYPWSIRPVNPWADTLGVATASAWICWGAGVCSLTQKVWIRLHGSGFQSDRTSMDRLAASIAAAIILSSTVIHGSVEALSLARPVVTTGLTTPSKQLRPTLELDLGRQTLSGSSSALHIDRAQMALIRPRQPSCDHRATEPSFGRPLGNPEFTSVALIATPELVSDISASAICWLGVVALYRRLRRRPPLCERTDAKRTPRSLPRRTPMLATNRGKSHHPVAVSVLLALNRAGLCPDVSPIGLVRITHSEMEFVFDQQVSIVPPGFSVTRSGQAVSVAPLDASSLLCSPTSALIGAPVLWPLHQDASEEWLLVLYSGWSVTLLGSGAQRLIANLADHSKASPGLDLQPVRGGFELQWQKGQRAFISTNSGEHSHVVILIDNRALTVHPFGITLKVAAGPPGSQSSEALPKAKSLAGSSDRAQVEITAPEVRLLTSVPRIDGLQSQLPGNRSRRAIELVAYLAIHKPDPVSSDRLRTRVLGRSDSDAAAKTLFNTIGAARRALGTDAASQPYLPNASRTGHYRVAASVGTDVGRVTDLIKAAGDAESVEEALAFYRAAFDLFEGEPFAGVLSGYGWWRSEGHEARFTSVVVEAACNAARLAIQVGALDLAYWVLDRCRLLDPYGEQVSQAAMAVAAASGDTVRLYREWDECRRRVHELDPEAAPSIETQRLFRRLAQSMDSKIIEEDRDYASFAAIEDAP
jgi:DNA-binding SARP family transcriptional activator